ncbi:ABC transporter permease [Plantactinospora solaniradicis]|uniref:ABC transporter permease n=1 Tax=Plantactinospora solaniradicis TaxID=1723736 RepID=A0ABW1K185_9ACTN
MSRLLPVIRVQLVGWPNTLGFPWLLLTLIFGINYALFLALGEVEDSPKTGAVLSIYIVMFIASINSITQLFPFTMALSVIRRTFYLAVSLLLLVESVVFGTALYLCSLLEDATDGWGLGLQFFGLGFLDQDNPLLQILVYTVPFIALGFLGIFIAVFYKRFGMTGMYVLVICKLLVLAALALLATWLDLWSGIGRWLGDQPTAAWLAGWPALLAALLASAGYLAIRRVTP